MEKYFIQEQKPIVDSDIKCFIHGKKSTMVCTFQVETSSIHFRIVLIKHSVKNVFLLIRKVI